MRGKDRSESGVYTWCSWLEPVIIEGRMGGYRPLEEDVSSLKPCQRSRRSTGSKKHLQRQVLRIQLSTPPVLSQATSELTKGWSGVRGWWR